MTTDPEARDAPAPPAPRWPTVIGTIGVVLGLIMLIDKADDLALVPLMWVGDSRRLLLGPEFGDFVARTLPWGGWIFYYIVLGMALGVLLVVGSLRLRRRRPSGVALCRAWAWLSLVWLAAGVAGALRWVGKYGGEVAELAGPGWENPALFGAVAAVALLSAYPVFLLVWLARAPVKEEIRRWRE